MSQSRSRDSCPSHRGTAMLGTGWGSPVLLLQRGGVWKGRILEGCSGGSELKLMQWRAVMAGEHGSAAGAGVQTELLAVSCSFSRSSESRGAAPAAQPVWARTTLAYWRRSWPNKGSGDQSCVSLLLNWSCLACRSSKQKQLPLAVGVGTSRERCSVRPCALVR